MSEIEKMYENCGIEIPIARLKIFKDDNGEIFIRPPFTAEKQISLIIFLSYKYDKGLLINLRAINKDIDIYDFELFGECLAKLVNELWQNLTEEEKQQIKEILK